MSVEEDFPIGCEVEVVNITDAKVMEVPLGTKAIVIGYRYFSTPPILLIVMWSQGIKTFVKSWGFARFRKVDNMVKNVLFCSCSSPNVVQNSVMGKSFLYCRDCGKERKQ